MYAIRIICGVLGMLLCYTSVTLAAENHGISASPSGTSISLQGAPGGSQIPAETPIQQRNLPSGQGFSALAKKNNGSEPLYVPGINQRDVRSTYVPPAWSQKYSMQRQNIFPPFGANLFQGYFSGTYYEGVNSNYRIMPGDRILVHIWGASSYNDTLMVDQQGNIFIPELGPMQVMGLPQSELQSTVRSYLSSVFKANVDIYVNLLTAQPLAIYVTGFVPNPGRYAGGMNDSVLYYLDRAGGIIPERGSYRKVHVQRQGKTVATIDLYDFMLSGQVGNLALREGDVIVVPPKGDSVLAAGLIPQQASYESTGSGFSGATLSRLAAPQPAVSHVSVTGTRNTLPFHVYLPLDEFQTFTLEGNDQVEFLADKPSGTVLVAVNGSALGPSRYPIKRSTTLRSLLAYVPVDPSLANLDGIYIKRRSMAEQQRKAIAESLQRLEKSVLTTTSITAEEAQIRVREAELVQNFIKRASELEPDGVVVVTKNHVTADILLEDGDEVFIPQHSDVVQISGEVMIPKAIVYSKGMNIRQYVDNAGGFTDRADKDNILIVHPNGEIAESSTTKILPGDLVLVMPHYNTKRFAIFKDLVQALFQIAVATKVIVGI